MKASRGRTSRADVQSGTGENRWFLVVADLDDELLTFEDFETMADEDSHRSCAQQGNPRRNVSDKLYG